jgi:HK97 family phage prohead protease
MPAIRSHSTETTDAAWDAAAVRRNIPEDATEAFYRRVFAYQDPDGDPDVMSTYSYPHHMVTTAGEVGAANTRACSNGIAALNGGRGGHSLSAEDRRGVWSHLARHLRDADMEPPELRELDDAEVEYKGFHFEVFMEKDIAVANDCCLFSGYASTWTKDLAGDQVKPGAFADSIRSTKGMVPLLYNHDRDNWIGLSTRLSEDQRGLAIEGEIDRSTSRGGDVFRLLKMSERMNYRVGLSIGFVLRDFDYDNGTRMLKSIDLWEVSFTPFPANANAHVSELKSLRRLERFLRDAGNYSRSEAKRIAAGLDQAEIGQDSSGTLDSAFLNHAMEAIRGKRYGPDARTVHRDHPHGMEGGPGEKSQR